ncbi:hypothetical protein QBC32DRAFT_209141 [Pseudoneurospora amorphoporcata]|uniref:Uncharacterized protein n=1 Tax=Pseudoneurospora amorphoporcata TaxID=241081 RepID=A0AAN6SHT3_9PEZI|nr:hypothetical protein QBC32DRAFT_209141 [Pseudoneurospora amorphoporcata]
MSSRPPNSYARRPSALSDRRPSADTHQRRDSHHHDPYREERREERYSERPSSSHASSLHNRPPNNRNDSHHRDRGLPNAPARGLTDTQTASTGERARPDHGPNPPATASSPTSNSRSASDVEITRCLRALCDSLISFIAHKNDLAQAEKGLAKRQADYNKSLGKLADFPSVPELQKKFLDGAIKERDEYKHRVRAAEDGIKKAREGFLSCLLQLMKSGNLPAALLPPASTSSKEYDDKIAELEQALSSHKTDTQANINRVEDLYDGLKSKRLLDQQDMESRFKDLEDKFAKQQREYETRIAKQQEEFTKQLKTELAKQRQDFEQKLAKQSKGIPKQSTKLEEQINKTQADLKKFKEAQEQELKTQLAEQQKKYETQLEQQLEQQRATAQDASKQSSATEVASLRQELADLHTRLGTREQELNQIRAEVAEFQQKMAKQEETLENIDFVALDEAAEIVSFGFPALKDRVTDLETKTPLDVLGLTKQVADLGMKETNVSGLRQQVANLDTKVTQVSAAQKDSNKKLEDFQNKFAVTFGQLVDAERGRINKLTHEVDNLKLRPTAGTPTPPAGASTANLEPLRAEFKLAKAEQQATIEEIQKQTAALDFAINNLSQRFNNITTKHVADMLLQQLIPETEKWKIGQEDLHRELDTLKLSVCTLEAKTAAFSVELEAQPGMKRRRTDLDGVNLERPASSTGVSLRYESNRLLI